MKIITPKIQLDLKYPVVMGILNITPDSFFDGGVYNNYEYAIQHASNMINDGASIIDIGGESTRPGAAKISLQQELDRVIPVIEAIINRFDILVSVDTSKAIVMTEAAKAGAHIINDVRSLHEPGSLEAVVKTELAVCIMHMLDQSQITPKTSICRDIILEVKDYLLSEINRCKSAGIRKNRLIIDPGFGYGKNLLDNYQLLAKLSEFNALEVPLLIGISRKSMVGKLLNIPLEERLVGSITCAVIAAMQGAKIIRAHDVKETVQAMKIIQKILSLREKNNYE